MLFPSPSFLPLPASFSFRFSLGRFTFPPKYDAFSYLFLLHLLFPGPETFLSKVTASTLCLANFSSSLKCWPICHFWDAFLTPQRGQTGACSGSCVSLYFPTTVFPRSQLRFGTVEPPVPSQMPSVEWVLKYLPPDCELCTNTKHSGN